MTNAGGAIPTSALGLGELSLRDPGTRLEYAHALPAWVWVVIVLACALFAGWTYWRIAGASWARVALAIARTLTLLLVAWMIAGPRLVKPNERTERDWAVLMVDRSRSMRVPDAPGGGAATRDDQLRTLLTDAAGGIAELAAKREVLGLAFDAEVSDLVAPAQRASAEPYYTLPEPKGDRTAIGTCLEQALRRVSARPVAGIVLFTDGRSFDAPSRSLLQELRERQIGVYPVPLGSEQALPDLAIARVDAPRAAFVGDVVPVSVEVDARGVEAGSALPGGTVELVGPTGEVLDRKPLPKGEAPAGQSARRVTLLTRRSDAGEAAWSVRLVPQGPDLSRENNTQTFTIELADRPLRLLLIDGWSRWEFVYLKNIILREKQITSSVMLLAADRKYVREGTDPIRTLPRSASDWGAFDVVVLGDVRPALFSSEQLAALRDVVAERGVGVLFIGGEGYTPNAWRSTPLGELLPFQDTAVDGTGGAAPPVHADPVVLAPTPAASAAGLLRLSDDPADGEGWPAFLSDPRAGWNVLRWAQRIEPGAVKPAAEVLARAVPVSAQSPSPERATPVVMTMRYGAGRATYVATDEIWRLRYGRGETLTERFWVPLIRQLARGSLGRSGKPALLAATPDDALVRQPVRISLKLLDQSLIDARQAEVRVLVREAGDGTKVVQELSLRPERGMGSAASEGSAVAEYTGSFVPAAPGAFVVTTNDPLLAAADARAALRVSVPEEEMRTPAADFAALTSLAQATGGKVLKPEDVARLQEILPKREIIVQGTPKVRTLWDLPVVWALLMLLLCAEWLGRRLIKLA